MKMHMNGGSKFSTLVFDVFADGKPTGITHTRHTGGSPKYLITDDVFHKGEEFYDARAHGWAGVLPWLRAHVPPEAIPSSAEHLCPRCQVRARVQGEALCWVCAGEGSP